MASSQKILVDYLTKLTELEQRLEEFESDDELQEEDSSNEHAIFFGILRESCALVRDAEASELEASNFTIVVDGVDHLINNAINLAYRDPGICTSIPSFAHTEDARAPMIKDRLLKGFISSGKINQFTPLLKIIMGLDPSAPIPKGSMGSSKSPTPPQPWIMTMRPHPATTPLARFREEIPVLSADPSNPWANIIYQARCEVGSRSIRMPIQFSFSSGGSCPAMPSMSGYKNRVPVLTYLLLDEGDIPSTRSVRVGLSDVAYDSTTDEQRKLIFIADHSRIKSYAWGSPSEVGTGGNFAQTVPMHTLSSNDGGKGPLTVVNGRLLRSSKGSLSVWNIDTLETHVGNGEAVIGGKFDPSDSWRDDPENIERSIGSAPDASVTFQDVTLYPDRWHCHPSNAGAMLCTSQARDPPFAYYCVSLDIETGKTIGRYLGHGDSIESFSTSAADQNVFVTGAHDGYARLYDVRHPLPVLTLDVGYQREICSSALITHPDGIATIFTGQEESEQIKMWDIRARTAVYELATGNNAVVALAWDNTHHSLYAATECHYVDRMGGHHGYRKAEIPKPRTENLASGEAYDEESGDNTEADGDDGDEDASFGNKWPRKAMHSEDYFGYPFDAAGHRLYRYAFKEHPNPNALPSWGSVGGYGLDMG